MEGHKFSDSFGELTDALPRGIISNCNNKLTCPDALSENPPPQGPLVFFERVRDSSKSTALHFGPFQLNQPEDLKEITIVFSLITSELPIKIPFSGPAKSDSLLLDSSSESLFQFTNAEAAFDFTITVSSFESEIVSLTRYFADSAKFVLKAVTTITGAFWSALGRVADISTDIRYTYNTSDPTRPDETVYVDNFLVSKGELILDDMRVAVRELTSKQHPEYSEVEYDKYIRYLPVYAANRHMVKFYLLDVSENRLHPCTECNFESVEGRRKALKTSINIYRLIQTMAPYIPDKANPLFRESDNITYMSDYIIKKLPKHGYRAPSEMYQLLKNGVVPCAVQVKMNSSGDSLTVTPKGTRISEDGSDLTIMEVAKAVNSVLACLQYLHSKGFVHRAIKWTNIIRVYKLLEGKIVGCSFKVINFESASEVGEPLPFSQNVLAEVVQQGARFNPHHDLICVGLLLEDYRKSKGATVLTVELEQVRELLLHANDSTTADHARQLLKDIPCD